MSQDRPKYVRSKKQCDDLALGLQLNRKKIKFKGKLLYAYPNSLRSMFLISDETSNCIAITESEVLVVANDRLQSRFNRDAIIRVKILGKGGMLKFETLQVYLVSSDQWGATEAVMNVHIAGKDVAAYFEKLFQQDALTNMENPEWLGHSLNKSAITDDDAKRITSQYEEKKAAAAIEAIATTEDETPSAPQVTVLHEEPLVPDVPVLENGISDVEAVALSAEVAVDTELVAALSYPLLVHSGLKLNKPDQSARYAKLDMTTQAGQEARIALRDLVHEAVAAQSQNISYSFSEELKIVPELLKRWEATQLAIKERQAQAIANGKVRAEHVRRAKIASLFAVDANAPSAPTQTDDPSIFDLEESLVELWTMLESEAGVDADKCFQACSYVMHRWTGLDNKQEGFVLQARLLDYLTAANSENSQQDNIQLADSLFHKAGCYGADRLTFWHYVNLVLTEKLNIQCDVVRERKLDGGDVVTPMATIAEPLQDDNDSKTDSVEAVPVRVVSTTRVMVRPRKDSANRPTTAESSHDKECVVCMDKPRDTVLTLCGHLVMCESCARNPDMKECPICRKPFLNDHLVKVFVS